MFQPNTIIKLLSIFEKKSHFWNIITNKYSNSLLFTFKKPYLCLTKSTTYEQRTYYSRPHHRLI